MSDQMPMFDDPISPVEQPPKRQKPKPMRRKKRKVRAAVEPKVMKKRRKRREPKVVKIPRLAVLFDACARITDVLAHLSPKERTAVLESIGHVA